MAESGGATPEASDHSDTSSDLISVQIKFGSRSIPLKVNPESSIKDIKTLLQPLTNVIPRGQKLIFKGKVLTDVSSIKSWKISNGSKIMMIASEGLHQGDGPIRNDTMDGSRKVIQTNETRTSNLLHSMTASRVERWKATGVVALSESQLKVIPEEIWECGASVRMLDLSSNFIEELPGKISTLKSVKKLNLSSNNLLVDRISWEGVAQLKSLMTLSLDHNQLTSLPSTIGTLTSLRQLVLANNKLSTLPDELGFLLQLESLRAENNRLSCIPSSIGNCGSLIEVDFSSNLLVELPSTFGKLKNLKGLHLSNNGLKSLPSSLFQSCLQLTTLILHGTEITNDVLRQMEGWDVFDERRRLKYQKRLDFRVGCFEGFDEGADKDEHF